MPSGTPGCATAKALLTLPCRFACRAVKYYNPVSSQCVVRCSRDEYRQVSGSTMISTADASGGMQNAATPCGPFAPSPYKLLLFNQLTQRISASSG
jgi:hypothetical protein